MWGFSIGIQDIWQVDSRLEGSKELAFGSSQGCLQWDSTDMSNDWELSKSCQIMCVVVIDKGSLDCGKAFIVWPGGWNYGSGMYREERKRIWKSKYVPSDKCRGTGEMWAILVGDTVEEGLSELWETRQANMKCCLQWMLQYWRRCRDFWASWQGKVDLV